VLRVIHSSHIRHSRAQTRRRIAQGHGTGGRAALELVAYGTLFPSVAGVFCYGATLDNEPRRRHLERPFAQTKGRKGGPQPGADAEPLLRPFQRFCPPLLILGGSVDASLTVEVEVPEAEALDADGTGDVAAAPPRTECVSGLRRVLWQGVEGGTASGADADGDATDGDADAGADADDADVDGAAAMSGGTTGGAVLAIIEGGTYGTPCYPLDPAAAYADADFDSDTEEGSSAGAAARRDALAELVIHWLDATVAPPGWPPGDEGGASGGGVGADVRVRSAEGGGARAEGLGVPRHASRAARAVCWPPEPDEYPLTELKCVLFFSLLSLFIARAKPPWVRF
jgi:hypothetical protein